MQQFSILTIHLSTLLDFNPLLHAGLFPTRTTLRPTTDKPPASPSTTGGRPITTEAHHITTEVPLLTTDPTTGVTIDPTTEARPATTELPARVRTETPPRPTPARHVTTRLVLART